MVTAEVNLKNMQDFGLFPVRISLFIQFKYPSRIFINVGYYLIKIKTKTFYLTKVTQAFL